MTGTLNERGIQAVGEHKGRVVVEGFIEEVAEGCALNKEDLVGSEDV